MSAADIRVDEAGPVSDSPRRINRSSVPFADRIFRGGVRSAGVSVLVIMVLIGAYLFYQSRLAFDSVGLSFFTSSQWVIGTRGQFGVATMLLGTVCVGAVAIIVAFPISLGAALYISEYAPPRLRRPLISLIDLMAAVPSIIYGLWGLFMFMPSVTGFTRWLADHLGFIPFLQARGAVQPSDYVGSLFIGGIVVALMIVPITTSVMREVFAQAPQSEREAAFALGATKWGMITSVVLPFGRGGIIGGTMLGLGRALGETIALLLVLTLTLDFSYRILEGRGSTISTWIANTYAEASELNTSGLMAAGLTLFMMTLAVNFLASFVVARSRSGAATEI